MKAVEMECHGLKCDAVGCDYRDETATFENYQQYLNAPCPKCGAPLLTEADYAASKMLRGVVDWLNALVPGEFGSDEPAIRMPVKMDGSGVPEVDLSPLFRKGE